MKESGKVDLKIFYFKSLVNEEIIINIVKLNKFVDFYLKKNFERITLWNVAWK